jgi:hypothetical protein
MAPTVLVATWSNGVFAVSEDGWEHELSGTPVCALTLDGAGETLAIVEGHTLQRRTSEGAWRVLATAESTLSCCVVARGDVFVGTDDARVFRWKEGHGLLALPAFERVAGRETWVAGQALVNGQLMGPPLGVRSISATTDGVLLANVHIGGIPRSTDGGATFQPTIAIETDVHEVRAHPSRPNIVAAAAGAGLCLSQDAGASWTIHTAGLHAAYCSAVAFVENDLLIAASAGHFAAQGRIYRRAIDRDTPLRALVEGLPEWTDGIVDTHCIAVNGSSVAFADRPGNLYVSPDSGRSWFRWAAGLGAPSSVHIVGV